MLTNLRLHVFIVFSFVIGMAGSPVASANQCSSVVSGGLAHLGEPLKQLRVWEQTSNQKRWEKPQEALSMDTVRVARSKIEIRGEDIPESIVRAFDLDRDRVKWPLHPLNESETPFKEYSRNGSLSVFYSASRSMFYEPGYEFFSVKVPTDRPHPNAASQPGKGNLVNDVIISMKRSAHIRAVDKSLGESPFLKVLIEVVSVADKTTGNGFLVRDLRPLQDGHIYLPAFSIPYAGREIAERIGADFSELWAKAYGTALGRAKAIYLLRYGLQMKTPNAQNWLIQLDSNLKPTGKIYLRDVPDSNYVNVVAKQVAPRELQNDRTSGYTVFGSLQPYWANSAWQMDEGGIDRRTLNAWGKLHDTAYVQTIVEILNLKEEFTSIRALQIFLGTEAGQKALKDYWDRSLHRLSHVAWLESDKAA